MADTPQEGADMNKPTWVTYYRIRMVDGRTALVQKRDGSTRTTIATSGARR